MFNKPYYSIGEHVTVADKNDPSVYLLGTIYGGQRIDKKWMYFVRTTLDGNGEFYETTAIYKII